MKTNVKELIIGSIFAMSLFGVLLYVCLGFILAPVLFFGMQFTIKETTFVLLELAIGVLLTCNLCGLSFVGLYSVNPTLWNSINKDKQKDNIPFVKLLPNVYRYIEIYQNFYKAIKDGLSDEQSGENQKKA